jgi:hypothetical protein
MHLNLLIVVVPADRRLNGGVVQAVRFEQPALIRQRVIQIFWRVGLSQLELRRVGQLRRVGRARDRPGDEDMADKPAIPGQEAHHDPVAMRFGVHLDVGVAPGSEQPFDAGADIFGRQRLSALERQYPVDIGRLQRLFHRVELDGDDPLSLESRDLRGSRHRDSHEGKPEKHRSKQAAHQTHNTVSDSK